MPSWIVKEPDTLSFDQVTLVRVRIVEGAVAVVGGDGPPTLEVSELVGEPLRVRLEDGELTIDYERPPLPGPLAWLARPLGRRRRAVLSLAVPRDCPVELRVVSASLTVGGLRAPVVARTISGEITLAGLGGPVEAETVSGPVQASGVAGDLSAATVSGDLTLAEGGGAVRARSVSGAIALDLRASGGRELGLSSVSGDVTVRLPGDSDLQVKLQSTGGQVASAFAELRHEHWPGSHAVRGQLGAGTGRLKATTTSGDIALLRRAPEVSS